MDKKIIEIAQDDAALSVKRGFLSIKNESASSEVPLDDILCVIVSSNRFSISKNAINAITDHEGALIFCGKNYMPSSITLPYCAHWQNGERIRKQITASLPLQKSLWKSLIQRKIGNQALVLEWLQPANDRITRLRQLEKTVKSGDTTHNESTAAQLYFKALFGGDFVRNRHADDSNLLLNYTYIVLRACVARAIVGAGLLPALGIMHTNKLNPFTLVDDVMEPYRPLADMLVFQLLGERESKDDITLTPEIKRQLAGIIDTHLENAKGQKPLAQSLYDTANSLAKSYMEKENQLTVDDYINCQELI